jgi:MoaA/NifB/PqqE/SkfB family radical SAM enzyme
MKPHLKLKEIIYEITGRCNNNCDYCGSKEGWNERIDEDKIKHIADKIAEFPPEEINISGGDPLLVSFDTHRDIIQHFKRKNIVYKILINPKSLTKPKLLSNQIDILTLYDRIGLSINTKEELKIIKELIKDGKFPDVIVKKMTVISNFNLKNVFLFDLIKNFVKEYNLVWQIQYTIFKEKNTMALYDDNDDALNEFFKKINDAINEEKIKIVIADNMNNGECSAGIYSLGILSNGDVVPCLSMRSFTNDIDIEDSVEPWLDIQGNILDRGLQDIWEKEFHNNRFCAYTSCKDHCCNKFFTFVASKKLSKKSNDNNNYPPLMPISPMSPNNRNVYVYGVSGGSNIIVYGVFASDTTTNISDGNSQIITNMTNINEENSRVITNMTNMINDDPTENNNDDLPF